MANGDFPYKVELHVHLDGAIRPETILELGKKKGILPEAESIEDIKKLIVISEPTNLIAFLECFKIFMPIIAGDKEAIWRVAYEFCEDCALEQIRYVEVRFCPHLLSNSIENPEFATEKGNLTPHDVTDTILSALEKGAKDFNITVKSILCCMTNRPEWSLEIAELCKEFKDRGVVAIDSAGPDFEPGKDPRECLIKQAFETAYQNGIHRTVHAGENGPSSGVKEALEHMYAERIGHGYHVMDDPELYKRCLKEQVHFEVCPLSSVQLSSVPRDLKQHPLHIFAEDGANFSINTDDPFVLDNCLTDDYLQVKEMGIMHDDVVKSIFNAARSSFCSDEEKAALLSDLKAVYGDF